MFLYVSFLLVALPIPLHRFLSCHVLTNAGQNTLPFWVQPYFIRRYPTLCEFLAAPEAPVRNLHLYVFKEGKGVPSVSTSTLTNDRPGHRAFRRLPLPGMPSAISLVLSQAFFRVRKVIKWQFPWSLWTGKVQNDHEFDPFAGKNEGI